MGFYAETRRKWISGFVYFLLVLGLVRFSVTGPASAITFSWDFLGSYTQSRAWIEGKNPYDKSIQSAIQHEVVTDHTDALYKLGLWTVYPPTTVVLLSPVSLLAWPAARVLWCIINLAFLIAIWISAIRLGGLALTENRSLLIATCILMSGPYCNNFRLGQLAIAAASLVLLALWAANKGRDYISGLLLGIAMGLKINSAAWFLLYFLITYRWKVICSSIAFVISILLVFILRMGWHSFQWLMDWRTELNQVFQPGYVNDSSPVNQARYQLINVEPLLYGFFDTKPIVDACALLILFAILLVYFCLLKRRFSQAQQLLALSSLAVVSLLFHYHRTSDAVILVLPIVWAFSIINSNLRCFAYMALVLMLPFVTSMANKLYQLNESGVLPSNLTSSWWWSQVVMLQDNWAICLLLLCLIGAWLAQKKQAVDDT